MLNSENDQIPQPERTVESQPAEMDLQTFGALPDQDSPQETGEPGSQPDRESDMTDLVQYLKMMETELKNSQEESLKYA